MSNALDDLFDARLPSVPYSFSMTDIEPVTHHPSVHFATGTLSLVETKRGLGGPKGTGGPFIVVERHYADESFFCWQGEGIHLKAPAMTGGGWANRLLLSRTPTGQYYFEYTDKTNPGANFLMYAEVGNGGGFPGFPELRTAVLVSRYWTGVATLVVGLPDLQV